MTASTVALASLSAGEQQRQLRRAVIASTVGTTIEWYDFFLYSTVTGLVFAKLYFPNSDPLVGTLQAKFVRGRGHSAHSTNSFGDGGAATRPIPAQCSATTPAGTTSPK